MTIGTTIATLAVVLVVSEMSTAMTTAMIVIGMGMAVPLLGSFVTAFAGTLTAQALFSDSPTAS